MKHFIIILCAVLLGSQLSAQVILGATQTEKEMLRIGSESSIFYGSQKFGVTKFATNDEYIVAYSEDKLAFFLIDKFDKQVLDEFKIYKKLRRNGRQEVCNVMIEGNDTVYKIKSLDIPVNFETMQFVNDSILNAGVFFGKHELEQLFLTISNNKLTAHTKPLDILSYYKPKASKKEKKKVIDSFRTYRFHKIYSINNNDFIILKDTLNPFEPNRNHLESSTEILLKQNDIFTSIYKDTLSRNTLNISSLCLNLFQVYDDFLVHYKVREDKYCFYDSKGQVAFEFSIKALLDKYGFAYEQVGHFPKHYPQLIKNNFTNQLYCIYQRAEKTSNYKYKYYSSVFEVKIDFTTSKVKYQFLKKIESDANIKPKEVVNNHMIYTLSKQKRKYLYKTPLYKNKNTESIKASYSATPVTRVEFNHHPFNQKYYKLKKRYLKKIYDEVKELPELYPNKTLEQLIHSLIQLFGEYRIDYINTYLSVAPKEELEDIYEAISKGEISSAYIASVYDDIQRNCKVNVLYSKKMLENVQKGNFEKISDTIIKIPISKEEDTETYGICVHLKGKWYLYAMFNESIHKPKLINIEE